MTNSVPQCTRHISSAQKPHLAFGCHPRWQKYRIFSSLKKYYWNSPSLYNSIFINYLRLKYYFPQMRSFLSKFFLLWITLVFVPVFHLTVAVAPTHSLDKGFGQKLDYSDFSHAELNLTHHMWQIFSIIEKLRTSTYH